jgi:hypothetical protein
MHKPYDNKSFIYVQACLSDKYQNIKTSLIHFKTYVIVKLFKQDETKYYKNWKCKLIPKWSNNK